MTAVSLLPVNKRLTPFLAAEKGELARFLQMVLTTPRDDARMESDLWLARAASLWDAVEAGLEDLAGRGRLAMNLQTLRAHLHLGLGVPARTPAMAPLTVHLVEAHEWRVMSRRAGLIEIHLRGLAGDLSPAAALAVESYVGRLPGFSLELALRGEAQRAVTHEVHGYQAGRLELCLDLLTEACGLGALRPEALRAALHDCLPHGQGETP